MAPTRVLHPASRLTSGSQTLGKNVHGNIFGKPLSASCPLQVFMLSFRAVILSEAKDLCIPSPSHKSSASPKTRRKFRIEPRSSYSRTQHSRQAKLRPKPCTIENRSTEGPSAKIT